MPIEQLKKDAEKESVNDWLHNYGLDEDEHLTAGEVEELVEAFWHDKKKFIEKSHSAGKKEAIEEIKKGDREFVEYIGKTYKEQLIKEIKEWVENQFCLEECRIISKDALINYLNTL